MCHGFDPVPLPLEELQPRATSAASLIPFDSLHAQTPNTPLVQEALKHVKNELPKNVFNHSHRAFYIATAIVNAQFPDWKYNAESFYLACLFHDIGCTPNNLKATKMSFEFFGGILAREWLLKNGASQDIADSVSETIFRHTDFVTGKILTHGQMIQLGTVCDNLGKHAELIHPDTVEGIVKAFPRLGWTQTFYDTMEEEKKLKPWCHTTALSASGFEPAILKNPLMNKYE